ncbi:hypothetical protein [Hydrogenophaga sp.]|uniref:hypothetical protein n=1 Tax=Hydrogenophaga sp. TaxID=1904254 RepID=UPI0025C40245|nr:hypothetical protein [Hydrogenophaga sp.]
MFKVLQLAVSAMVLSSSFLVHAGDKAFLLEGSFLLMSERVVIKDCMQDGGMPQDEFVEICQGASQAAASMGGAPAKITYLAACSTAHRCLLFK